jgi:predicted RNase H-like nuclease (RuvC/YqgF family)
MGQTSAEEVCMNNEDMKTSPTIETLLERINAIAQQVSSIDARVNSIGQQLIEVRDIVVELRDGQEKIKAEMAAGFKQVERKIAILNDTMLSVQSDQRDHENRLEKLESKTT